MIKKDYYLPRNAIIDLLFALTTCALKMDEDGEIRANGTYDLLTGIIGVHPDADVMMYQLMEIDRIEGHDE